MTTPLTGNWLAVVGLAYAGIGILLVATALKSSALLAGASAAAHARGARAGGAYATFGAVLTGIGFFLQAVGQFRAVELGPVVAALLVGLIGMLALFAMADLSPVPEATAGEGAAISAEPQAEHRARHTTAASDAPMKLVMAAGA